MAEAIRVLYVDDESALLDLCKIFLERSGDFIVTTCPSAPEAIRILELTRFDAIVSDYQMPEMDGIAFLKVVRARGDKTPFIIFTGKGREEVVIEALNSGADFYLQKGGEPRSQFAELVHKIRHAVSHRQADKALIASEERYRTIFENTGSATVIIEDNTIISFANTRFEYLSGFLREELEGKKRWTEFVVKEDLDRMLGQHKLRRVERDNASKQYEFRFITRSKEIRNILLTIDIIPGTNKSVASLIDITERKASEQALRRGQIQLAEMMDLAHMANWEFDVASGNFTFNDRFYNLYGTTAEREGGYQIPAEVYAREFVHPEEVSLVSSEVQNAINATGPDYTRTIEHRIIRRDGEIRHIIVRFGIIKDADGRTVKTYGANQDITERKKAEEALRQSESRYRTLSETSQDLIFLIDSDDCVEYVNSCAAAIRGLPADQIIGKKRSSQFPGELGQRQAQGLRRVFETGKAEHTEGVIEIFGTPHWFDHYLMPITDAQGIVTSVLGVSRDITDEKKAEDALRENEAKSRLLLENLPELILVHRNGIILFANPATVKFLGYQPHEVINRRITDFIAPEFHEHVAAAVLQRMNSKPVASYEIDVIGKEGSRRNMVVNGSTIEFDGAPASLIILTDITALKRVEEKLKRNEARLRAVVEDQTEFICRFTPDGRLTFVNEAYCRYFGLERTQCLSQSHHVVLPPEDARLMKKHLASLTRENPVAAIDHRIIMPSGEIRWQRWNDRAIFGEDGRVIEYQSVGRDITDRKTVEIALYESEERFQQIAESAGEWIWEVDADGVYTFSNAMVYQILGYTPEEMIKRKHFYDLFVPEDKDRLKESAFRAFANHEPFKGFVNANLHKNGDRVILATSGLPVFDTKGTFNGYRGTDIDITTQVKAEEVLRQRERELSDIISFLPDATLVIDKKGTLLAWNRAMEEMTGVPAEQMIGKADYEYALPFYHERRPITADLVLHYDPTVAAKYPFMKKKGNALFSEIFIPHFHKGTGAYLWFKASPLYDAAGNISGAIETIRDITNRKRAGEALKESEERYREFFAISRDSVFITSPDGRWVDFNDALLEMGGYESREEMLEMPVSSFYAHPEEQPKFTQQIIQNGYVKEYPVQLKQKDGTVIDTLITTGVVRNPDGSPKAFIGTIRNVTEKKHAEEEIRTLQQFQQNIIDNANVWISVLDPRGSILVWNTTAEQISGYCAAEVIGNNTIWKRLYPNPVYRKQVMENIHDIIKKNTYVENFETQIRTKKGDEKIIWWNTQPLRDASGKPVQFITIGRDYTERKHSEEKLRALRQFEESIIKNANIWISVLDSKGNVSVWNRAAEEISGYRADEVIGNNTIWSRMYPDKEYRHTVTAKIKAIIGSKTYLKNFETRIRTKDGQERIIWWNTRTLQDIPGIDETFIAIGRDVTEQKTLSDALWQANKQLSLLSSITRHDILNQLLALKGYIELSRHILSDPVKLENYIIKEQNIADRIEEQIQFTKDYEDMGIKAPEWQNVHKSVEKAKQSLLLGGIAVETDRLMYEVYADKLLMRVFYNLIENALRYGGEQMTAIRFSSQESGRGLEIVCEDNGVGIPADMKEAIFTRGYYQHTGLGLLLSREILAITGITITENGTPGKSARFEIIIPKEAFRRTGIGEK
jgi:PAS domain S-box-containing protein